MIKIRRNFKKKWRVATGNQRRLKTKEFIGLRKFHSQKSPPAKRGFPCETISLPKGPCCKIGVLLRNKPPPAKSFRSHKPISCEIFCSCETPLRCTRAISQLRNPPKPNFTARSLPSEKFRSYETTPRHMCAISQPPKPISQLRNELWNTMWNPPLAAKWPSSCENPNHHLNTKLNL